MALQNIWNSNAVTIPVSGTSTAITVQEGYGTPYAHIVVGVSAQLEVSADLSNWYLWGSSITTNVAVALPLTCRGVRAVGGITSTGSMRVSALQMR